MTRESLFTPLEGAKKGLTQFRNELRNNKNGVALLLAGLSLGLTVEAATDYFILDRQFDDGKNTYMQAYDQAFHQQPSDQNELLKFERVSQDWGPTAELLKSQRIVKALETSLGLLSLSASLRFGWPKEQQNKTNAPSYRINT
ncbi:MAG: hypothetical protein Q7R49_01500 [Candidatus Daviesbacteria bacterium]|nr:hypothetical protein [Candidatus Daviesbacteria bacterium]